MRCLFLLSGGLDSILGVKLLQLQNIEVDLLVFTSCFFSSQQAEMAAEELGLKLRIYDFSQEHLELVKNPSRGYGKNMNPCVDCHLLMLTKAREIMESENYDFVATGEVLGERPMSQNRNMLDLIEHRSGLVGKLLRPLSAKLLEPTILESEGKIDREKFESISGRGRERQFELAKKFKIKNYPTPAGGCVLTDQAFSQRLRELFAKNPQCDINDAELLKFGRHFWLGENKLVIGRDEGENEKIKSLKKDDDYLFELEKFFGPVGLLRGSNIDSATIQQSAEMVAWYSTKARKEAEVEVNFWCRGKKEKIKVVAKLGMLGK
ncbi:MAG: tRNA 4-thiouridine(8) synthase ThiI [Patescibacteria group bacterium]